MLGGRLADGDTAARQALSATAPGGLADAETDVPERSRGRSHGEPGERLFEPPARTGSDNKPAIDAVQGRASASESASRFSELLRTPTAATGPVAAAPAAPSPAMAPVPAPALAPAPAIPTTAVAVPMQASTQATWNQAFSERVVWMARGGIQEAQIQLNPRHLGPVEVRLSVHQDQVNVQFTAQNATTREAIEQALPRLRDLLGDSGLQLGQADVGDYGRGHAASAQREQGRRSGQGGSADGETAEGERHEAAITVTEDGAVDYYA
jgi:flagellar hook-length control protein FliK